jgi:hypothetical protein
MARRPRIEYPGALYHVITRGNHRQKIFYDDHDRRKYLEVAAQLSKAANCNRVRLCLFAYGLGGMLKGRDGRSAPSPLSRRLVSLLDFILGTHPITTKGTTQLGGRSEATKRLGRLA